MNITKNQESLLRHMLGADSRYLKKDWGFRNHFCDSAGSPDEPDFNEMLKGGLVNRGERFNYCTYWATELGAKAIGFKKYQLRKLFRNKAK